jgi:2-keto-3-deoxy-L-rhamnonate aldolase RhmA
MPNATAAATFRHRLRARELLVGTWVKTPAPVVDAEHAPFGRAELDACMAICRASGVPALVRVPSADPAQVLNALDGGACGVVVPHVDSVAAASSICRITLVSARASAICVASGRPPKPAARVAPENPRPPGP